MSSDTAEIPVLGTEESEVEVKTEESIYLTEVSEPEQKVEEQIENEETIEVNEQDKETIQVDTINVNEDEQTNSNEPLCVESQTLETVQSAESESTEVTANTEQTNTASTTSELLQISDLIWKHQWTTGDDTKKENEDTETEDCISLVTHTVVSNQDNAEGTSLVAHMASEAVEGSSIVAHVVTQFSEEAEETIEEIVTDIVDTVTETSSACGHTIL